MNALSGNALRFYLLVSGILFFAIVPGCFSRSGEESVALFNEALRVFEEAEEMKQSANPDAVLARETDPRFAQETKRYEELQKNEFRKSAALYQGMIDQGIESGAIFYNQGNAWFRAGEPARALASYRRAERYIPGSPYLQSNIRAVALADAEDRDSSFLFYVFFWQNSISYPLKFRLTLYLALTSFALALTSLLRRSRTCWKITATVFAVSILAFVSTLYDYSRFERTRYGIVQVKETVARKGNSPQYEPAFTEALKQCCEFQVLDERGSWIHFRLPNGQTAWIPKNDAVVY